MKWEKLVKSVWDKVLKSKINFVIDPVEILFECFNEIREILAYTLVEFTKKICFEKIKKLNFFESIILYEYKFITRPLIPQKKRTEIVSKIYLFKKVCLKQEKQKN